MICNICLCGAQAGYPHTIDCPFPYFGRDAYIIRQWHDEHLLNVRTRVEQAMIGEIVAEED